jgi:hypothetical protein
MRAQIRRGAGGYRRNPQGILGHRIWGFGDGRLAAFGLLACFSPSSSCVREPGGERRERKRESRRGFCLFFLYFFSPSLFISLLFINVLSFLPLKFSVAFFYESFLLQGR